MRILSAISLFFSVGVFLTSTVAKEPSLQEQANCEQIDDGVPWIKLLQKARKRCLHATGLNTHGEPLIIGPHELPPFSEDDQNASADSNLFCPTNIEMCFTFDDLGCNPGLTRSCDFCACRMSLKWRRRTSVQKMF